MDTDAPQTRTSLAADFDRLGVRTGQTLLVHSSMRSLGWVCGGSQTVVAALLDAVGPDGTIVVPTQTNDNSDPEGWAHPAVPRSWWPTIREEMPPYDPAITPSRGMGAIAEQVRTWPKAARSAHPQTSFAAVGAQAEQIMARHPLECSLGPDSPLGALERSGAFVLLVGVGYDSCTAFHLAEYRQDAPRTERISAATRDERGTRTWRSWTDIAVNDDDFAAIGSSYEHRGAVRSGRIGAADARLFPMSDAVAHAADWMTEHRP